MVCVGLVVLSFYRDICDPKAIPPELLFLFLLLGTCVGCDESYLLIACLIICGLRITKVAK
jgi:hypothetical protein